MSKVRIRLKAYDHRVLDTAVARIIETVNRTGGEVSGPVPLPSKETMYALTHLDIPSGVEIDIKTI